VINMFQLFMAIHLCSLGAGLDMLLCGLVKNRIREHKERFSLDVDRWVVDYERIMDSLFQLCQQLQSGHLVTLLACAYCILNGLYYLVITNTLLNVVVNVHLYGLIVCSILMFVLLFSMASVSAECDSVLQYIKRLYRKQTINQIEIEGLMLYLATERGGYHIFQTKITFGMAQTACFALVATIMFLAPLA